MTSLTSRCFLPAATNSEQVDGSDFRNCSGNGPGAVEHSELLRSMVEEEANYHQVGCVIGSESHPEGRTPKKQTPIQPQHTPQRTIHDPPN